MKIWAELPQEPLGQRCNYCFLSVVPSGQGGGRSSFTRKESVVECSFTGKEPAVEHEVERMKCEKMNK